MNILVADDEEKMVKILATYFKKEGFNVFTAYDGEEAINICISNNIDLAILDWMMPKVDGIEACKYIKDTSSTKVLMLTAKSQSDDELEALNCGADDYVKKPFDTRVLILRAKKLIGSNTEISAGDLKVNLDEMKVYKDGQTLQLTKIEFELLRTFINNKGIILSRDKLIELIWGIDYEGDYRTVDTHIRRLRTKIGEDIIKTYRGIGYSLEVNGN